MTVCYVEGSTEGARQVYESVPNIKFLWRLVRFDNFTERSLFKVESELIPAELDHKLVKMVFEKLPNGEIALMAEAEADQSLLSLVGVDIKITEEISPKSPRKRRKKKVE